MTNPFAKRLRQNATEAERRLWNRVRNRQLGGWKFRRQVTIGPCSVDFAFTEAKLIIEIDGGQHATADESIRTAFLESRGYRLLRFWNNDVLSNVDVCAEILRAEEKGPSPNPLPHAGEGPEAGPPLLLGGIS